MSMVFDLGEGSVKVEFDETLYPRDAVFGTAYVFIDRCYVHLDRVRDQRVLVQLKPKKPGLDPQALAGEFQNELLSQAWRQQIVEQNKQFVETITARALGGAAGAPGLDELLAMDIGEETAFDDPLGIAMSWEEKYKKKGKTGDAKAEGEPATDSETSGGKTS